MAPPRKASVSIESQAVTCPFQSLGCAFYRYECHCRVLLLLQAPTARVRQSGVLLTRGVKVRASAGETRRARRDKAGVARALEV